MQILPGHAALISELKTGVLTYSQDGTNFPLHVSGGFMEVNHDKVSVLAEIAERPEEIDAAPQGTVTKALLKGAAEISRRMGRLVTEAAGA